MVLGPVLLHLEFALLALLHGSMVDLIYILSVFYELFIAFISFLFSKDGFNFLVEILSSISHIQQLEGVFDCDSALELAIVHQEDYQVVEFSWF